MIRLGASLKNYPDATTAVVFNQYVRNDDQTPVLCNVTDTVGGCICAAQTGGDPNWYSRRRRQLSSLFAATSGYDRPTNKIPVNGQSYFPAIPDDFVPGADQMYHSANAHVQLGGPVEGAVPVLHPLHVQQRRDVLRAVLQRQRCFHGHRVGRTQLPCSSRYKNCGTGLEPTHVCCSLLSRKTYQTSATDLCEVGDPQIEVDGRTPDLVAAECEWTALNQHSLYAFEQKDNHDSSSLYNTLFRCCDDSADVGLDLSSPAPTCPPGSAVTGFTLYNDNVESILNGSEALSCSYNPEDAVNKMPAACTMMPLHTVKEDRVIVTTITAIVRAEEDVETVCTKQTTDNSDRQTFYMKNSTFFQTDASVADDVPRLRRA